MHPDEGRGLFPLRQYHHIWLGNPKFKVRSRCWAKRVKTWSAPLHLLWAPGEGRGTATHLHAAPTAATRLARTPGRSSFAPSATQGGVNDERNTRDPQRPGSAERDRTAGRQAVPHAHRLERQPLGPIETRTQSTRRMPRFGQAVAACTRRGRVPVRLGGLHIAIRET